MKPLLPLAALACGLALAAQADDDAKASRPTYHDYFASCAHQSKGMRGEEHQRFMSECLKDHGWQQAAHTAEPRKPATATAPQQHRMQSCNEEARAKNLHGDERRAFMSACLKG